MLDVLKLLVPDLSAGDVVTALNYVRLLAQRLLTIDDETCESIEGLLYLAGSLYTKGTARMRRANDKTTWVNVKLTTNEKQQIKDMMQNEPEKLAVLIVGAALLSERIVFKDDESGKYICYIFWAGDVDSGISYGLSQYAVDKGRCLAAACWLFMMKLKEGKALDAYLAADGTADDW